jgi:hypothetical protein
MPGLTVYGCGDWSWIVGGNITLAKAVMCNDRVLEIGTAIFAVDLGDNIVLHCCGVTNLAIGHGVHYRLVGGMVMYGMGISRENCNG